MFKSSGIELHCIKASVHSLFPSRIWQSKEKLSAWCHLNAATGNYLGTLQSAALMQAGRGQHLGNDTIPVLHHRRMWLSSRPLSPHPQKKQRPFDGTFRGWSALAGTRTRVNCLASSYAACYTTNAPSLPSQMPAADDTWSISQLCLLLRLHGHGHYIPQWPRSLD